MRCIEIYPNIMELLQITRININMRCIEMLTMFNTEDIDVTD